MSIERGKIDIENWQGPMTVVGYPDLSVLNLPAGSQSKTEGLTVPGEKNRGEKQKRHPQHHV